MWRSRNNRDGTVVCIACGTSLPRSEAREYDKEGNRWERHGKSFEHLCKECYRGLCHQPRDELESLLVDVERAVGPDEGADAERAVDPDGGVDTESDSSIGAESGADPAPDSNLPIDPDATSENKQRADQPDPDRTFLAEYFRTVEERYGPAEETGNES